MKEYTKPFELHFGGRSCPREIFVLLPKCKGLKSESPNSLSTWIQENVSIPLVIRSWCTLQQ